MNTHDDERMQQLLKQSVPLVEASDGPSRDLWPDVLHRLDSQPTRNWAWFDAALLAGLAALAVTFPASIPLLLYYL